MARMGKARSSSTVSGKVSASRARVCQVSPRIKASLLELMFRYRMDWGWEDSRPTSRVSGDTTFCGFTAAEATVSPPDSTSTVKALCL